MRFEKKVADKICELYNEIGDISMLNYLYELNLNDTKARSMLNNMIELNDKMLDTDMYFDYRREFLSYLGFDWDDENMLVYTKDYKVSNYADTYYYSVFVLGRDLLKSILPYEDDLAYEFCKKVATDFEESNYNDSSKGLYECLEEYVKDKFYLKNGKITWKGEDIK